MGFAVLTAVLHDDSDIVIGYNGRGVADLGSSIALRRICIFLQEVRQFHDMAIGIFVRARSGCVGHLELPDRSFSYSWA